MGHQRMRRLGGGDGDLLSYARPARALGGRVIALAMGT